MMSGAFQGPKVMDPHRNDGALGFLTKASRELFFNAKDRMCLHLLMMSLKKLW